MKKSFLLIIIIILLICCNNKEVIKINEWIGKSILYPQNMCFTKKLYDTIFFNINSKIKILYYIDSIGCLDCKFNITEWDTLISNLKKISNNQCITIISYSPKNHWYDNRELLLKMKILDFKYPICIDYNDSLNKLNHFPSDERFHCFLLDENNKVILIGNPVQNPKIKDLYIRTICERLGIDTTNIKIAKNQENSFSFGRFPFSDTMKTQFVLRNDSLPKLMLDSIFTSCECTTAKFDKSIVAKNDSAIISVTFKTDKPEEFMREIYVKTNLLEKPLVYEVDGVAY